MNKQDILGIINDTIQEEKGVTVTLQDKFSDAQLDSLGSTLVLATLDAQFEILPPEYPQGVDLANLTITQLVKSCMLPNTTIATEQNEETAT